MLRFVLILYIHMNTVDVHEIEQFRKDSAHWWDENGPFKPLHKINPVRTSFIRAQIVDHFGLDDTKIRALENLDILDTGCGGGLMCEPLCRLGANVTGIDADPQAIEVAKAHADHNDLEITYKNIDTAALLSQKSPKTKQKAKQYDVVLALEIIEHVSDPETFIQQCSALCKPDGLVIFSTLNRTPKSFALGIVAAEYVLGWVPKGTHNWKKFIKPSELTRGMRLAGLSPRTQKGLVFHPLANEFALSDTDFSVNYFMSATKTKTEKTKTGQ